MTPARSRSRSPEIAAGWAAVLGPKGALGMSETQDLPFQPDPNGAVEPTVREGVEPEELTLPSIARGFREPLPLHVFLVLRADGMAPTRAIQGAFESFRSDTASVEAHLTIARVLLRKSLAMPNRFAACEESVHADVMRDRAARHIQVALAGDPDLADAHALMAVVLEELAETEASLREWEAARALGQGSAELTAAAAVALARAGETQAALQHLAALDEESQRSIAVMLARADISRELDRPDEAARLLEAAASKPAPATIRSRARNGLGLVLWKLGQKEAALEAFTGAVEDDPSAVESSWNRGVALDRLGAEAQASALMKNTALLAPWDGELALATDEKKESPPEVTAGSEAPSSSEKDRQLTGALCVLGLEDVLDFLSSRRLDGFLKVTSGDNVGVLCMWRGELVGAVSPASRPVSEILSHDARALSPSPQELALEGCRLLGDGRYEADTLRTAVGEQIRTALHEMLKWRSGSFAFARSCPGDIPDSAEHLALDTRFMLMDIIREMDEAAAGCT